MSIRGRLQGALVGSIASVALWTNVSRDMWMAQGRLVDLVEFHRLTPAKPKPTVQYEPPLKLADAPDWR